MAASMHRVRVAGCYREFSSLAAYLMLPSNKMYSLGEKKVMNIESSKIEKEFESDKVVGSSHGWVGLMKEEEARVRCGSSSSLSLWNPRSGSRVMLPPLHTIPQCSKSRLDVKMLMVDDAECSRAIIGLQEEKGSSRWLGVCCPGRCNEWTLFGRCKRHSYEDVVACSQGRVYSVKTDWELVRWNVSDPRRPRREWEKDMVDDLGIMEQEEAKKKYPRRPIHDLVRYMYQHLVYAEQSGQLFVVTRHYVEPMKSRSDQEIEELWKSGLYPSKTLAFDVHLLVENENKNKNELRHMEHSLDGLVMFVGINNSFAAAAQDFPHLKPDCIYFTDHRHTPKEVEGGHDVGIYDYKNRTVSSCYYPTLHRSFNFKGIPPYPFWLTSPTSILSREMVSKLEDA